MFESTISRSADGFRQPVQMIWLGKVKNAQKLSSHAWFFYGICQQIIPDYVILLNAGAKPAPSAFSHLYQHFEQHVHVGAAGGELMVEYPGRGVKGQYLGQVQYLEWKMSYIFEVPLQHMCGYIQVLPGAFSAYRYKAVEGDPLTEYFNGYYQENQLGPYERNKYLAEDRILCVEIVAKKGCRYRLSFVKEAKCTAGFCDSIHKLISQRRRWLNGSFFATIHSLTRVFPIWKRTRHSIFQKLLFSLEFTYLALMLLFNTVLGVGLLFTLLKELVDWAALQIISNDDVANQVSNAIMGLYACLILIQLILGLNNKPKYVRTWHWVCTLLFGIFQYALLGTLAWYMIKDFTNNGKKKPDATNSTDSELEQLVRIQNISFASLAIVLLTAVTAVCILLHGQLIPVLRTFLQYWLFSGAYVNVLQIFAFTNAHDSSWGTKGLSTTAGRLPVNSGSKTIQQLQAEQIRKKFRYRLYGEIADVQDKDLTKDEVAKEKEKRQIEYRLFSTKFILFWIISNGVLLLVVSMLDSISIPRSNGTTVRLGDAYLRILLIGLSILRLIQILASLGYILYHGYNRLLKRHEIKFAPLQRRGTGLRFDPRAPTG